METDNLLEAVEPYVTQLREEGWCVIEDVIPASVVDAVREEVETSEADYNAFSKEHGRWERNVISFMPKFAEHLANDAAPDDYSSTVRTAGAYIADRI